jgi:hypothetical protein
MQAAILDLHTAATEYWRAGLNTIPVENKKPTVQSWKRWQTTRQTEADVDALFQGKCSGLAIVFRADDGIWARDVDRPTDAQKWIEEHPDAWNSLPRVQTPSGGFHLYGRWLGAELKNLGSLGDGEFRCAGSYVVAPPTPGYVWVNGDYGAIPELDPAALGLCSTFHMFAGSQVRRFASAQVRTFGGRVGPVGPEIERADVEELARRVLPGGSRQNDRSILELARELKGLEVRSGRTLTNEHKRAAIDFWLANNKYLRESPDSYRLKFINAFPNCIPKGRGPDLDAKLERAKVAAPPARVLAEFQDPQILLLGALCRELQRDAGAGEPFFLDWRSAGACVGVSHVTAGNWLGGFVELGILKLHAAGIRKPGGKGKATEYVYLPPLDE